MSRLAVWGDSITWGASDFEGGGWVSRLRRYIDNDLEGEPSVYNLGVSGDKVNGVLIRFQAEFDARRPDTILLAIGINDSPHASNPQGTSLAVFEKLYTELVDKMSDVSKRLILVGPTNVDGASAYDHGYSDDKIDVYRGVIKKIASEKHLEFIDLWGLITRDDLKLDGLHPDSAGHEKIFSKVKAALGI